jgi:hypothetical protein
MAQTVSEVLTAATDSVTLINSVNGGSYDVEDMEQSEINDMVQRNVDHLEIILAYAPIDEDDETPDVAGSDEDKSAFNDAISTGKSYIENNS